MRSTLIATRYRLSAPGISIDSNHQEAKWAQVPAYTFLDPAFRRSARLGADIDEVG